MIKQHPKQLEAFKLAKTYNGLKEIPGPQHEAEIVKFFLDVGHSWVKNDETAWCAAFVGAMLERSGLDSTRQLNAKSYEHWGEKVELEDALPGDIAVFDRDGAAWMGHVTFFAGMGERYITGFGGNQLNSVRYSPYSIENLISIRRMPAPAATMPSFSIGAILAALGAALAFLKLRR